MTVTTWIVPRLSISQHLHHHAPAATAVEFPAKEMLLLPEYDAQRFGTYDVLIHREDWRFKDSFVGVGGRSQGG